MKNYTAINKEQYKLDDYRFFSDEYYSLEWEEREKIKANQRKLYKDYLRHSGGWEISDVGEINNTLVKSLRYFPNSSRLGLPDEYRRCDETPCSSEEMDDYDNTRARQDSYQYDSFQKPRGFNFFDKRSTLSELFFNIDIDDPETDLKETYTVSKFLFTPASDNKQSRGKGTNEHSLVNAVDNCKRACEFGNLDAITRAMEINPNVRSFYISIRLLIQISQQAQYNNDGEKKVSHRGFKPRDSSVGKEHSFEWLIVQVYASV